MMTYRQLQLHAKTLRSELPVDKQREYKLNGKKNDLEETYETLLEHTRFNNWISQLNERSEILDRTIENKFEYSMFFDALYHKLERGKYLVVGKDSIGREFEVALDTNDKKRIAYRYLAVKLGFNSDGETDTDYTVSVYKEEELDTWATESEIQQRFKLGEMNCFIEPLIDWYTNKRDSYELKSASWIRYNKWLNYLIKTEAQVRDEGVTLDLIKQVCKHLSVNVFIKNLLNNDRIVEKCVENARKNFVYYNTKFEHVDHYFNDKQPEIMTSNEIHDLYDDLVKRNVAFMYKKSLDSISEIMVCGKSYENENIVRLQEIYTNFEEEHDHAMVARYSERQFEFMASEITSNGRIQLRAIIRKKPLFEYDQNQAFAEFKEAGKYYLGFPIPTQFRVTPSSDPQFAINNIGNYECKVDLSESTDIAKLLYKEQHSTIGLTSADINFLIDNKAKIELIAGCWGSEKYDFDFPEEMIDKFTVDEETGYKVRPFSIWTGRQEIVEQQNAIYLHCDDPSLVYESSDLENERFYEENSIYKLGKSQYKVELKKEPKNIYSRIHIATFILAYQRINLALQLEKMDLKQIVRIHTDGIYTHEELTQNEITATYRQEEVKKSPCCGVQDTFINETEYRIKKFPEYRDIRKTTKCEGLGGGGKTHVNLIDEGLISVLFVAPSNRLMTKKREDYQQYNHKYTNYAILRGSENKEGERQFLCSKYNPRNIILDEGSLISIDTVKYTISDYKFANIICCGDPKQLQFFTENESDDEFDPEEHVSKAEDTRTALEFKYEITYEFNTSYRCKDQNLLDVLLDVRENDGNIIHKHIDKSREIKLEDFNQNPDKYGYNFNDEIICATRKLRKKINDTLKTNIKKYRVVKKHRFEGVVYYNGDYIEINDESELMKMIMGKDGKPLKRPPILYEHAGTCHSLEGITAEGKIFICIRDMDIFEGYLYTALSRAQYLDQIYILV